MRLLIVFATGGSQSEIGRKDSTRNESSVYKVNEGYRTVGEIYTAPARFASLSLSLFSRCLNFSARTTREARRLVSFETCRRFSPRAHRTFVVEWGIILLGVSSSVAVESLSRVETAKYTRAHSLSYSSTPSPINYRVNGYGAPPPHD